MGDDDDDCQAERDLLEDEAEIDFSSLTPLSISLSSLCCLNTFLLYALKFEAVTIHVVNQEDALMMFSLQI